MIGNEPKMIQLIKGIPMIVQGNSFISFKKFILKKDWQYKEVCE